MKKLYLFALLAVSASCDITYEPETRLIFKSHLTDIDGAPAVGVRSELRAYSDDASDLLSVGYSDANGDVTMVFPKAERASYSIEYARVSSEYQAVSINYANESMFENYTYSANMRLDRIGETVMLNMTYIAADDSHLLESVSIQGLTGSMNQYLTNDVIEPETQFKVYKNQTVVVQYTVREANTNVTTAHSTAIGIGEETIDYTLIY